MSTDNTTTLLQKALDREKTARYRAEKLLEDKASELYLAKTEIERQFNFVAEKNRELELLQQVASIADNQDSFNGALRSFVDAVCDFTSWPIGHIYVPSKSNADKLVSLMIWNSKITAEYSEFRQQSEKISFMRGVGLPGRVLATASSAWIENLQDDNNFPRIKLAGDFGLNSGFAIPIKDDSRILAVCEFFSNQTNFQNAAWLKIIDQAGVQLERLLQKRNADKNTKNNLLQLQRTLKTLHEAQVQLIHSEKLASVGHLAAGIAHEINTPIQYVGDNTRFLQEAFQTITILLNKLEAQAIPDLRKKYPEADLDYLLNEVPVAISQSLDGVDRVAKIVSAMKEFSHPSQKEKQATDINRALETTTIVARNEWKYVADLELDLDPNLPHVPCHADEMNQVYLNLIVNAAHAVIEKNKVKQMAKGLIKISTKIVADKVEIRISDSGNGIAEPIRHKIFDPFFTTKDVGQGTGQGLAISRSVVIDKHGGNIFFETAIGEGTTFVIQLPLK